jgi:diguanylate cyclase (GGDEF)-like protein
VDLPWLHYFEPSAVLAIGSTTCFILAFLLLFQSHKIFKYRYPLLGTALCLFCASMALYLALSDLGENLPARMRLAQFFGVLAYSSAMLAMGLLYAPKASVKVPLTLIVLGLAGAILIPDPRAGYLWGQGSRVVIMVYTANLIAKSIDEAATLLKWFAFGLACVSAIGMTPTCIHLYQMSSDTIVQLVDPNSNASRAQAILWAISPVLLYACVTGVIYLRIAAQLRDYAYIDSLTGAHNRRYLFDKGVQFIERRNDRNNQRSSLLLIDVDHFKKINDQWGHAVGDQVLKHCVKTMKDVLRLEDNIVGRYGGEEFCVLLSNTAEPRAEQIAERIRTIIANSPYQHETVKVPVTVSIGIALKEAESTLASLLSIADQRLYQAKHLGRNRVVSSDTIATA